MLGTVAITGAGSADDSSAGCLEPMFAANTVRPEAHGKRPSSSPVENNQQDSVVGVRAILATNCDKNLFHAAHCL